MCFNQLELLIEKLVEEKDKYPNSYTVLGKMNALNILMIIRFTQHQTTTLPKWMFSQKPLFNSSLLLNGSTSPNQQ